MVKFSDVQKDIEKLEKETGTLFVDYNRLHRYSHAEKSEYDWKVLFEPAKKLWGSDYKNLLPKALFAPFPTAAMFTTAIPAIWR